MNNPIERVEIENFGAHQQAAFDFAPGINLIRGPNRSGKTWILRALAMALYNRGIYNKDDALDEVRYDPSALGLEGEKARQFRIAVTFANGLTIKRERGPSDNICGVIGPKTTTDFGAIGRGFFEPLADYTGLFPVELDGKTPTIPNLHLPDDDHFFLVGESGTQQDAILSRLVGIDVIEQAAYATDLDAKRAQREADDLEDRAREAADEAVRYDDLPSIVNLLQKAAGHLNVHDRLIREAKGGRLLLLRLASAQSQAKFGEEKLTLYADVLPAVVGHLENAAQLGVAHRRTVAALASMRAAKLRHETATAKVKVLTTGLEKIALLKERLEDATNSAILARNLWRHLVTASTHAERARADGEKANESALTVAKERTELLQKAGRCPLCQQTIKD